MKTDTLILIKAMRRLANDIQSDDGVANAAIEEAADRLTELERENAALKQRIIDDNRAYGCELRDPSGTIWDHAKRLQDENAALRELVARMATEMREVDHEFASLRDYDAARKEAQP